MRINKILSNVKVLGPGRRTVVWFQGCNKHCPGCIAPEMQPYDGGFSISAEEIMDFIGRQKRVDGVTFSGGEPFDQSPDELAGLVEDCDRVAGDVLIYTGYSMEQLKEKIKPDALKRVLDATAVLITGPYKEEFDDGRSGLAGSGNQRIRIMKNEKEYIKMIQKGRVQQIFADEQGIFVAGIPGKEFKKLIKGEH